MSRLCIRWIGCLNLVTIWVHVSVAQEAGPVFSLDQRVRSYDEFENEKKISEKNREEDRDRFLKNKKNQEQERAEALEAFLVEKKKQKKIKPEDTPEYEVYLRDKWVRKQQHEQAADEVALIKKNLKPGRKAQEFELREYALMDTEKNRIPFNRRKPLGHRANSGSSSSGGSSFGGFGGGGGGYQPNIPPPPMEDIPDFDNDIPPPPPPPLPMPSGGGDFYEGDPIPMPPPPME